MLQFTQDPVSTISLNNRIEVDENEKNSVKERVEYLGACLRGDVARIEEWIKSHPRLVNASPANIADIHGNTALMYAAGSKNLQAAQLIASNSSLASIQAINKIGRNALFYACDANDEDMVKLLFTELRMTILADQESTYAGFYAVRNPQIQAVLQAATRRRIEIEAGVGAQIFRKYMSEGSDKARQMVAKALKRPILYVPIDRAARPDGLFDRVDDKKQTRSLMSTRESREEVLQYVKDHLSKSNQEIRSWIKRHYGYSVKLEIIQKYREAAEKSATIGVD